MRKKLLLLGFAVSILAVIIGMFSNTTGLRNSYNTIVCWRLSDGINRLFQGQNKYRNKDFSHKPICKGLNCYYLQKGKHSGFEAMRNFIINNYYKKELGYTVKAIVQYQTEHKGRDSDNPVFHERTIFFIKETQENKNIDLDDSTCREMLKRDNVGITTQKKLTKDLDTFFTSRIQYVATFLLAIGLILNFTVAWFGNKKQ